MTLRQRSAFEPAAIEQAAADWWNALHEITGEGVPWDEASDEAKEATREYVKSTGGAWA